VRTLLLKPPSIILVPFLFALSAPLSYVLSLSSKLRHGFKMSEQNTLAGSAEDIGRLGEKANMSPPTSPSSQTLNGDDGVEKFKLPMRSWLVFLTLAVLTLMVALDGTSISVALPVSFTLLNEAPLLVLLVSNTWPDHRN
jgi:hypothetical protein